MSSRPLVTAPPVARLIEAFHRLPGIGPKSAQRLAYHVLRAPRVEAEALATALVDVKDRVRLCSRCQNVTEQDPCALCSDAVRDQGLICVVEEPLDTLAVERAGVYAGLYHVLHGALSPMDGVGPEKIKIRELVERVRRGDVREVILATNATMEGDATASYLVRLLQPFGVAITRIARGLPVGADVEYADEVTLGRALRQRVPVEMEEGTAVEGREE